MDKLYQNRGQKSREKIVNENRGIRMCPYTPVISPVNLILPSNPEVAVDGDITLTGFFVIPKFGKAKPIKLVPHKTLHILTVRDGGGFTGKIIFERIDFDLADIITQFVDFLSPVTVYGEWPQVDCVSHDFLRIWGFVSISDYIIPNSEG